MWVVDMQREPRSPGKRQRPILPGQLFLGSSVCSYRFQMTEGFSSEHPYVGPPYFSRPPCS